MTTLADLQKSSTQKLFFKNITKATASTFLTNTNSSRNGHIWVKVKIKASLEFSTVYWLQWVNYYPGALWLLKPVAWWQLPWKQLPNYLAMNYPAETFSCLTWVTNYHHCTFTSHQEHISSNDTVHYHEPKYNWEKSIKCQDKPRGKKTGKGERGKWDRQNVQHHKTKSIRLQTGNAHNHQQLMGTNAHWSSSKISLHRLCHNYYYYILLLY